MSLKMRLRNGEPIGFALRRFRKLVERTGITKELRKHAHYEKPSEIRRREKLRKKRSVRKSQIEQNGRT